MYIQFAEAKSGWMSAPSLDQGGLYIIDARNAYLGVWNSDASGFQIARTRYAPRLLQCARKWKWESHGVYLSEEKHWDEGEPFGTAKPLVFLEQMPLSESGDLLAYLVKAGARFPKEIAQALVSKCWPGSV